DLVTGYPHITPSSVFDQAFTITASRSARPAFELPKDWDAALEAFRATKKKELNFELPYAEGVLKLKVEKDKITLEGEEPFHPAQIAKNLNYATQGNPSARRYLVLPETFSIGCKKGIRS